MSEMPTRSIADATAAELPVEGTPAAAQAQHEWNHPTNTAARQAATPDPVADAPELTEHPTTPDDRPTGQETTAADQTTEPVDNNE